MQMGNSGCLDKERFLAFIKREALSLERKARKRAGNSGMSIFIDGREYELYALAGKIERGEFDAEK